MAIQYRSNTTWWIPLPGIAVVLFLLLAGGAVAQPQWVSSFTAVGEGNSASISMPNGTTAGDLLVVGLTFEKGTGVTSLNPPSGWTLIRRTNQGSDVGMATFSKVAGASEVGPYIFTMNNTPKWAVGISRITGADAASPIMVSNGGTGDGSNTTAPSVTTTADNALVLAFYGNKKNATYTPASGTVERYDHPNNAGGLPSNMMATFLQATAGATGIRTAVANQSEKWMAQQVAIRCAGAPAPTGPVFQSFCSSDSPTVADLEATGTGIQWFSVPTGGSPLANSAPLTTGTYYAGQTAACGSARLMVVVEVESCVTVLYSTTSGTVNDNIWSDLPQGAPIGQYPTSTRTIVIQAGHTLTVNTTTMVDDLVLEAGGTLVLPVERLLVVHGNEVVLNGTVSGAGMLSLEGSVATTLSTTGTVNLHDLTIAVAGGTTVEGTFRILGTLELVDGVFDAATANVILRSTTNGTGRLGPVGAGASYVGDITAQRRVPAGVTNWRLLGSPVQGRTVADWNDDFLTAGFPGSNYPNFDSPVGSGILWPSVRWYDETNTGTAAMDGLIGVSSMAQTLDQGRGYAVWSGDAAGGTQAFIVDVTGAPTIAQSPITLPMSWTNTGNSEVDGLNLVSNPLPSPIAFSQVARGADVENAYWIYNPTNGNNASWNGVVGTNGANGIIQSSQGFWLKANGPAVTTTVNEGAKVSGNTGGLFGGPAQMNGVLPVLRLKVSSGLNTFTDEAVVVFEGGTPSFESGDVEKFIFSHPSAPQIGTRSSDGQELSINMYGTFDSAITIPVRVNVPINGTYTITATELSGVDGVSCMHLEDLVTGSITALSAGATYSFSMQANPGSTAARFLIHATAPVQYELTANSCFGDADGEAMVILPSGIQTDVSWMDAMGNVLSVQQGVVESATFGGLAAGNYMVSVGSDAGCGALVRGFTIATPFALEASFGTTAASCPDAYDGSIMVDVLGGTAPYSFDWSNGGNGASIDAGVGVHTVIISDANGCMLASDVVEVGYDIDPSAWFELEDPILMAGQPTVFINTSVHADGYEWHFGDGNMSTLADPVHVYTIPGVYTVVLTVINGFCTSSHSQDVTVQVSTGAGAVAALDELRAWSTGDAFMVVLPNDLDVVNIRLHDAAGALHLTSTMSPSPLLRIPAESLSSGIWFLTVETGTYQKTMRLPLIR